MLNSRFLLVLCVISLLSVSMVVSFARSNVRLAVDPASDFHQRHPDWVWTVREPNVVIPVAGGFEPSDYFQRHPELIAQPQSSVDMTDYYFRHLDD